MRPAGRRAAGAKSTFRFAGCRLADFEAAAPAPWGENHFDAIYLSAIAIILSLILGAFVAQNLDMVTLRLLGFSISLPMSGLAVIIYVLGAFTGSGLYAVIRHSYSRARRHPHGVST